MKKANLFIIGIVAMLMITSCESNYIRVVLVNDGKMVTIRSNSFDYTGFDTLVVKETILHNRFREYRLYGFSIGNLPRNTDNDTLQVRYRKAVIYKK